MTESWLAGKVYGTIVLPSGFGLIFVPRRATFKDGSRQLKTLSSSSNALSILIPIGQLAFAITALYRSRGDQIARYGYAAFGLTVTQYAMMSLVNLLGNLLCRQYPVIYLVESVEMKEARNLPNAVFEGVVGELDEMCDQEIRQYRQILVIIDGKQDWKELIFKPLGIQPLKRQWDQQRKQGWRQILQLFLSWVILGVTGRIPITTSILIIYSLTHFRKASSTVAQRVWIMYWFSFGSSYPVSLH
jgi:hypothetical protein